VIIVSESLTHFKVNVFFSTYLSWVQMVEGNGSKMERLVAGQRTPPASVN